MPRFTAISHLLLDIEGTTCPVDFVAHTLFPYAAARLEEFLRHQAANPHVQGALAEAELAWREDRDPQARMLWQEQSQKPGGPTRVLPYLQLLIQQNRKLTALKDLQGMIWCAGYASGDLVAPLFSDVAPALRRWQRQGVTLAVYSSGSIPAQQLLYGHTNDGDLRGLFSHWFDTRTGPKKESGSYTAIAQVMEAKASQVLFISDCNAECAAARDSGMAVLFSERPGNPDQRGEGFARISDYNALSLEP
jgi:enolase-phosphatase E1